MIEGTNGCMYCEGECNKDCLLVTKDEDRPWGRFEVIRDEPNYKAKILEVLPGKRLSKQYHLQRSEIWVVASGTGSVEINDTVTNIGQGAIVQIPVGAHHRVENTGTDLLVIMELQTGSYFGEDDIVRIEDDWDRK